MFATPTGLFEPSKWSRRVDKIKAVYPDSSGLKRGSGAMGVFEIVGPDSG
jgi:hypothetical protein